MILRILRGEDAAGQCRRLLWRLDNTAVELAMQVLLVSQDPELTQRVVSALPGHLTVTVLNDVIAARQHLAAASAPVDVLVLDGDLQPRGGYALLYDIREQSALGVTQSPPAVILTERAQDRWLARWAGANATETKPTDPFRLARTVLMLHGATPGVHGDKDATAAQLALANQPIDA